MLYNAIRIVFVCIVIFLLYTLWRKKLKNTKKFFRILVITTSLFLCLLLSSLPFENLFIDFRSPEAVFSYTTIGEITDVVYGEDSCMIFYSTKFNSNTYSFVQKVNSSYKIAGFYDNKRISSNASKNVVLFIYHVLRTNDYYVTGVINGHRQEVILVDGNGLKIDKEIYFDEHGRIHFYLNEFTNDYYLLVDGEKVLISSQ